MQETTTHRFPAKRTTLIGAALAVPVIVAGVFLASAANASPTPAPANPAAPQTFTASASLTKDSGATITSPDGAQHAAPSSGWVSVGPDGKVRQGTGTPPADFAKGQSFSASAPLAKDADITITNPDGTQHTVHSSGSVTVGPDGAVHQTSR